MTSGFSGTNTMMSKNREKNLFLETDLSLHEHCDSCIIFSIPSLCDRYGCAVISCPHDCGHRFHSCKTEEHLLLCPLVKTPCINACYGCPFWMTRKELGGHLSVCPASVVYCNMERNRKPLREYGKKLKRKEGRIDDDRFNADDGLSEKDLSDGMDESKMDNRIALDLALAYSDQCQINGLYRLPRSERKSATNFFNKRHPAVPLLPKQKLETNPGNSGGYTDEDGDSSDDEAAARKRTGSVMSPVARECILCKIDPSSQHLHQLGSTVQNGLYFAQDATDEMASLIDLQSTIELDENANESNSGKGKGKTWTVTTSKGASFYADRGLLIDLSADFLPAHYPKCGSYYTIVCDQSIRRDQYASHFSNVHNDVIDGLDGWALTRCPLWRYGCGCYASRLEPKEGDRKVVYNPWRDSFAIQYSDQSDRLPDQLENDGSIDRPFLALPYDIIHQVCSLLDSSSLFCLAGTCRSLNQLIRYSLLPIRGIVERAWMKTDSKTDAGRVRWVQGPKRWRMSKSFEPIDQWRIKTIGRLVDHIQKCPYNEPIVHKEKRIPVLTFVKPFDTRPSRQDMYRAVPAAVHNQNDDDQYQVFDF